MWCKENKNGVVSCDLDMQDCYINVDGAEENCHYEFEIQDIMERGYSNMIEEDYWGQEYNESYIYDFVQSKNQSINDFVPFSDVIQMALQDFDNLVCLC